MRMKTPCLLAGILMFVFISCQKEVSVELPNNSPGNSTGNGSNGSNGGSSSGSEIGTWKFMSIHGTTSEIIESNYGPIALKDVAISDYITQNNTGTVKFDGTNCTTTGIGYDINTNVTYTDYANGLADTTFQLPMMGSVPATDATGQYKKIGSDSLYLTTGGISTIASGGTVQSLPTGYKLRYYGADSMTMTSVYDDVQLIVISGQTAKTTDHSVIVISLKKQ